MTEKGEKVAWGPMPLARVAEADEGVVGGDGELSHLLTRCRAGDPDAWNQIVGRYERLVFTVALHNGLSRDDSADVTQATFVALLESMHRIHTEDSLPSWLMTVARRHSWRLRQLRERDVGSDTAAEQPHDPVATWESSVVVRTALDKLAGPCRDLLVALYFDPAEPSYAEIAARLGRAIGGIGPMRSRCLQRLRDLIADD